MVAEEARAEGCLYRKCNARSRTAVHVVGEKGEDRQPCTQQGAETRWSLQPPSTQDIL